MQFLGRSNIPRPFRAGLLLLLFNFINLAVFTQENTQEYDDNAIFIISTFDFNVDGITRPFAIISSGGFELQEEIKGISNLEKYIQEKTQILNNKRVFQSVDIEYSVRSEKNGKYPVDVVVNVKDSRNFIILPQPTYSTNSGYNLVLKARDYNFLGTMQPLRIDLGYRINRESQHFLSFLLDSSTPFVFLDLNWNFTFLNDFQYRPDLEKRFYFKNTTGLSVNLPFNKTTFILGFNESLIFNEEVGTDLFQEGFYMTSHPSIAWVIPTNIIAGDYGTVNYVPSLSATFYHELPPWPLIDERQELTISFYHYLNFGRVDWIGNFRKGASGFFGNGYSYSFRNKRHDSRPVDSHYSLQFTNHFIIKEDFFGISSRVMLRHWLFSSVHDKAVDVLR
jgi:hypothetical protein